jgi:hypothetical protein
MWKFTEYSYWIRCKPSSPGSMRTIGLDQASGIWYVYQIPTSNPYISAFDTPMLDGLISLIIQFFFCHRIWMLSKKSPYLPTLIGLVSSSATSMSTVVLIRCCRFLCCKRLQRSSMVLEYVARSLYFISISFVTGTRCWKFRSCKSSHWLGCTQCKYSASLEFKCSSCIKIWMFGSVAADVMIAASMIFLVSRLLINNNSWTQSTYAS